jgi:hypothetical protein
VNASNRGEDRPALRAAAEQFRGLGRVLDVSPYGKGNVHDTYLVRLAGPGCGLFLLQRLNTRVFPRPRLVLGNIRAVTEHLERRLEREPLAGGRQWEIPRVLPTPEGGDHWVDGEGCFWRAQRFVEAAHALEVVRTDNEARELGWAVGTFHSLVADLPVDRLADTLEGFHVTPLYLRHYDEVLARCEPRSSPEVDRCLRFVAERREAVHVLEDALARGRLRLRPIHGDPKADNVLVEDATGLAVSLVDLDTVKPGLLLYDVGDCLRSGCNPMGEETERWEEVRFELDLCEHVLGGYLSAGGGSVAVRDRELFYEAARLIAFELGLRFFTDYLEGDVYFRARREGHNLARALVQFRLAESLEAQETLFRSMVGGLA